MSVLYSLQYSAVDSLDGAYQLLTGKVNNELSEIGSVFTSLQPSVWHANTDCYLKIDFIAGSNNPLILDNYLESQESKDCSKLDSQEGYLSTDCASKHHFLVRSFTKLDQDALLYILDYRNSDAIRQHMLTNTPLPKESHLKFCEGLKFRPERLYMLNCLDFKPTSVAAANADCAWDCIQDYGMYAVGTVHPERSSYDEQRIPVYAIDRVVIAHLVLSRGVKEVNFQFKRSNPKSIYVNLHKHNAVITKEDSEFVHTKITCDKPASFYLQQIVDFCQTYQCCLEFDID